MYSYQVNSGKITEQFGLSHLTNSIFSALKVSNTTDSLMIGQSQMRECLILIDGLGQDAIDKFGDQFEIFSQVDKFKTLAANFPSTTATSLSTLGTGVLPGVHGMLGYTVRVPRSDNRLLNALKWDERVDPVMWQKVPTMFERASAEGVAVTHVAAKRYEGSGFTQAALRGAKYVGANGIDEMATAVAQALKPQPSFVYTYLNTLDAAGHSDGVGSDKWLNALQQVSEFITKVKQVVPQGTRVWITSDHGMVNSTEQIILGQDNDLLKNVTLIGGEPRARHIYIKAGAEAETVAQWQEFFKDRARILSKQAVIESGLFGSNVSEDSVERMGDLIAIAQKDLILIDPTRVREESSMVGHHGGTTDIEVLIPLLLA
jgi:predicted AlkP superfamily pyrophosphatase or phosphodiesterase